MATRPRTDSTRTRKTAAPTAAPLAQAPPSAPQTADTEKSRKVASKDENRTSRNEAAADDTETSASEVTASRLERRPIPSFSESREARIAEAAYWRAERRGFTAGQELDDWLAAEREIDSESETATQRKDA